MLLCVNFKLIDVEIKSLPRRANPPGTKINKTFFHDHQFHTWGSACVLGLLWRQHEVHFVSFIWFCEFCDILPRHLCVVTDRMHSISTAMVNPPQPNQTFSGSRSLPIIVPLLTSSSVIVRWGPLNQCLPPSLNGIIHPALKFCKFTERSKHRLDGWYIQTNNWDGPDHDRCII